MRKASLIVPGLVLLSALAAVNVAAQKTLDIYFIDVEGGQATLIVSPAGESMLVDAGWPGFDGRDAARIAAAAAQAGVTRIDYLVVTHYHRDHVGGVPQLAAKLPIRTFVDHGPTVEAGADPDALFRAYAGVRAKGRHLQVKAGDKIPVAGIDVQIVAAGGELIERPLAGGAVANPLCKDFVARDLDPTENARSVGMVIGYGRFRMLNLGDLTWNKERDLVCPDNPLGAVDLYLTTHHGMNMSGPAVLVHAIRPRVAVMNNGARKGGTPEAWRVVRSAPGLEDLWQLHYSIAGAAEHNAPEPFIANLDETTAHGIKVSVDRDGGFVVTNARNGHSKRYGPRP